MARAPGELGTLDECCHSIPCLDKLQGTVYLYLRRLLLGSFVSNFALKLPSAEALAICSPAPGKQLQLALTGRWFFLGGRWAAKTVHEAG